MNSEWQRRNLGDVCSFVRGPFGGSLKKEIFVPKGFAVYEQQHAIYNQFDQIRYFIDEDKFSAMQRFELQANDLIMSCSGTMGKVAVVPVGIRKGIINQALLKLTPSKEVHCFFLKYWMESQDFQEMLKEQAGGAAIQNVASVSILKEIKIPLPSFEEQHRIVTLLDEAFADIATAKANAEKNLQNATSIFENHLQAIFSTDDSTWERKRLGDVFTTATGTTPPKSNASFYGDFIPLVKPPELLDDVIESAPDSLTESGAKAARVLPALSVLVSCIGNLGKIGINTVPVCFNQQINAILPNEGKALPDFMFYQALSPVFKKQLEGLASGTTVPIVNKSKFNSIQIALPPLEQQANIVEQLKALREETKGLESIYHQKLTALDDLKKSLLHQAFSGQL